MTLWLPVFMTGAEWAVRCPTHSGVHAAGSHTAMSSEAAHDHGHPLPGDQSAPHKCSCPGPGCCPPAVAVVPNASVPMARIVAIHEAAAVSTLALFPSDRDHVLPFATAPPVA